METIYESKYKKTVYEAELSLISNFWTDVEMDEASFKQEVLAWVELVEKYKSTLLLADTRSFNYTVSVEMQAWTNNDIFPRLISAGAKKFAIIESEDVIAQLALELTMEEETSGAFTSRFFANIEEGRKWLEKDLITN